MISSTLRRFPEVLRIRPPSPERQRESESRDQIPTASPESSLPAPGHPVRAVPRTRRLALRQPAGDARGDRGGSLDVQEVTEVRHDLEDTRVEQPTVLVGRRHDAAVVAAMELQQRCCNVRLGLAYAIDECREWAHDRAVVLERCGEAALETGVQLVTARGVEREARRPGAPQAIDQGELRGGARDSRLLGAGTGPCTSSSSTASRRRASAGRWPGAGSRA